MMAVCGMMLKANHIFANSFWKIIMSRRQSIFILCAVFGLSGIAVAYWLKSDLDQKRWRKQISHDMGELQGKWVVTDIDDGSRGAYHDWIVKNAIGVAIAVEGDSVIWESPGGDPSTITLNPSQPFNGIDLQMWDIVYHGIYELSNGTWKVCFPDKSEMGRPKSMAVSPEKLSVYIELRKQPVGER